MYSEIELFTRDKGFSFEKVKGKPYDFILRKDNKTILVNILSIPSNSSVTINSKSTWCLRYGGKRVGRSYPNKRYLNELVPFLSLKSQDEEKIVLFYPSTEKVLKYVNESDICEIKPKDISYGYRAMTVKDFYNEFDNLFNK